MWNVFPFLGCVMLFLARTSYGAEIMDNDSGMAYHIKEVARIENVFRSWVLPSIAVSDDGTRIAISGVGDETAMLWDTIEGKQTGAIHYDNGFIPLQIDPKGRLIAASTNNGITVVEIDSGKRMARLPAKRAFLGEGLVAFSPSGRRIAYVAAKGRDVCVFQVCGGRLIGKYGGCDDVVHLSFEDDSKLLCLNSAGQHILSVERAGLKLVNEIRFPLAEPARLLFASPMRGIGLFSSMEIDGSVDQIVARDLYADTLYWRKRVLSKGLCTMSGDGRLIALVADNRRSVDLFASATGHFVCELTGPTADLTSIRFAKNGSVLVATTDYRVHLWKVERRHWPDYCKGPEGVRELAVSPDGDTVALEDQEGTVWVWDNEGCLRYSLRQGKGVAITGSPLRLWRVIDGGQLVGADPLTGDTRRTIVLPQEEHRSQIKYGFKNKLSDWDVSASGNAIVYLFAGHGVASYDLRTQETVAIGLNRSIGPQASVAASQDGKLAAILYHNPIEIQVVDFTKGQRVHKLEIPAGSRFSYAIGRGAWNNTFFCFAVVESPANITNIFSLDSKSGRLRKIGRSLPAMERQVVLPSFLAVDDRFEAVALGHQQGITSLFSLSNGQKVGGVNGHTSPVGGHVFVEREPNLVSIGIDGNIAVWRISERK